jgi:multiphosphoryl transfer protein
MVSIVIVSHSKKLAEGVRELVQQMVQDKVPIAIAAGIDDPENPLGTDAMQVYEAIASVYSDDGVLVLMDLGSALLSAEMAIEFLPEAQQNKIHLCEAPLVEGAIAASVAATSSNDINRIISEARQSLTAKAAQLGVTSHSSLVTGEENANSSSHSPSSPREIHLTIQNPQGLHARPAAQFVTTVTQFQAQIRVRNITRNTEFVRADSINQVATLGARQGHEIAIAAEGGDADIALSALQQLVENNFGETHHISSLHFHTPSSFNSLQGIPASPGIAIAPVFHYRPQQIKVHELCVIDVESEWQRLQTAIEAAKQEIQTIKDRSHIHNSEAAIFDAHLLVLADPAIIEPVRQRIFEQHQNAEFAWNTIIDEIANNYHHLDDIYLQERAKDIVDVGQRVLRSLLGITTTNLKLTQPSILIAHDLSPSDTVQLDKTKVLGICTLQGSATSHSAILARTLGIPAVVGINSHIFNLAAGTLLAIDGEHGNIWIQPDRNTIATLEAKQHAINATRQQAQAKAQAPAIARDGKRIQVFANISSIDDAKIAIAQGAEGIGLLRTEFLYLDRTSLPTEAEQLEIYRAIAQILADRPLIIRTLDIGGDKPLAYLGLRSEFNPFLGWRGIRFCLDRPDIFKTQLRAILRASLGYQIKVMFPTIATLAEIQAAKAIWVEAQTELRQADLPFNENIELGVTIEIPSAVAIADKLAAEVNFFSIGTNDLSQYIMAADRTNPKVAALADAFHPAVLQALRQTVRAAHHAGIRVGLCGELAAEPLAVPILLGLGLDELSLNPQSIPQIKQIISQLTIQQAEAIAHSALQLDSATQVKSFISNSPLFKES